MTIILNIKTGFWKSVGTCRINKVPRILRITTNAHTKFVGIRPANQSTDKHCDKCLMRKLLCWAEGAILLFDQELQSLLVATYSDRHANRSLCHVLACTYTYASWSIQTLIVEYKTLIDMHDGIFSHQSSHHVPNVQQTHAHVIQTLKAWHIAMTIYHEHTYQTHHSAKCLEACSLLGDHKVGALMLPKWSSEPTYNKMDAQIHELAASLCRLQSLIYGALSAFDIIFHLSRAWSLVRVAGLWMRNHCWFL